MTTRPTNRASCCGGTEPPEKKPLLSQRSALIFLMALFVATCIGLLTYSAFGGLAYAAIAGIGAFAAANYFGIKIIE